MARPESRKSIGVFAVLYLALALGGGTYLWMQLKPAFESIDSGPAETTEAAPKN